MDNIIDLDLRSKLYKDIMNILSEKPVKFKKYDATKVSIDDTEDFICSMLANVCNVIIYNINNDKLIKEAINKYEETAFVDQIFLFAIESCPEDAFFIVQDVNLKKSIIKHIRAKSKEKNNG